MVAARGVMSLPLFSVVATIDAYIRERQFFANGRGMQAEDVPVAKDDRHVAYVQVWAKTSIPAFAIVVTAHDDTESSAEARADNVLIVEPFSPEYEWGSQMPVGVSDTKIMEGKRGTIVLSGIVMVQRAVPEMTERLTGSYFTLADTVAGNGIPNMPLQPLGTVIQPNLPGVMVGSKYCPTVSIFLCPWLCAAKVPVVPGVAPSQVHLGALFTPDGFRNFSKSLAASFLGHITDDATLRASERKLIVGVQEALFKGAQNGGLRYLLP